MAESAVIMKRIHGAYVLTLAIFLALVWLPDAGNYWLTEQAKKRWNFDNFFLVRSVEIGNTVAGEPVLMNVDREILAPFRGSYSVDVRTFPERSLVCRAGDSYIDYNPDNNLPNPLTLAWWADNGDCSIDDLTPGEYIVVTTWTLHPGDARVDDQNKTVQSNPFTVTVVTPEEAEEAIGATRSLKLQVEQLQQEVETLREETD